MTTSAIDYRSGSAAMPAPVLTGALSGMLAIGLGVQSVAAAMRAYHAVDFLPWRLGVGGLAIAAAGGLPTLAAIGLAALRGGTPAAAAAMGRFLRFAAYALVLSFLTTLNLESSWLGGNAAAGVLTAIRGLAEIGLLIAAFVSLQRSATVMATCGRTFPARVADAMLRMIAGDAALTVILMLVALVGVLAFKAKPSIQAYGAHFLVSSDWRSNDVTRPKKDAHGHVMFDEDGEMITETLAPSFGALPVIYGTIVSSMLALVAAIPLSFGAALFLVRIVPRLPLGWLRSGLSLVSFLIEFLAAIPSIAYGIWGWLILSPFLAHHIEPGLNAFFGKVPFLRWLHTDDSLTGRDMLCAAIVLAIMILPIITAISRDVLRSVPRPQIEGTLALGATWWQSCWGMLRYGKNGLFGAVMLGLARAAGETMAVTMVIGCTFQIRPTVFAPAQTMASLLASDFGDAPDEVYRGALVEIALILLVMSLLFNVVARWLVVGDARAATA